MFLPWLLVVIFWIRNRTDSVRLGVHAWIRQHHANPPVLRIRIRDPVLFDPWIRDEKSPIQFFDADPDLGTGMLSTLDPGW